MRFQKQLKEPLYPHILWNRPVNRQAGGKLLIVGGHSQKFNLIQQTYQLALGAGAGSVKVVLPKSIRSLTGNLPDCLFVDETPSGSLAKSAYNDLLGFSQDCDAVLLPGELSFNNETVSLVESFITDCSKPTIVGGEVVMMLLHTPETLLNVAAIIARPQELSELAAKLNIAIYVKKNNLHKELDLLQALGEQLDIPIISYGQHILVTYGEKASLTQSKQVTPENLLAEAAVFYMQHSDKFEALTTAAYQTASDDNGQ